MTDKAQLAEAFDNAIDEVRHCRSAHMECVDGSSAAANLDRLEDELVAERANAVERGSVDKQWFQTTLRWLVDWVPETELTLIAALGGIARAQPSTKL
jgi:hypothetical protein